MKQDVINALKFFSQYPGWHSFAKDSRTTKTINYLVQRGLLETNQFSQARMLWIWPQ